MSQPICCTQYPRDPRCNCCINNCVVILSHGGYTIPPRPFNIPNNIRLVQYSTPDRPLSGVDAYHILDSQNLCNIVDDGFFVNFDDRRLYRTAIRRNIVNPGEETQNLNLTFTGDIIADLHMGLRLPLQTMENGECNHFIEWNQIQGQTLEQLLNHLSTTNTTITVPLTVVQLSCRVGGYGDDPNELARQIEALGVHDDTYNLIDSLPGHTENDRWATFRARLRNNTIQYFTTREAAEEALDMQMETDGGRKKRKRKHRRTKHRRTKRRKQFKPKTRGKRRKTKRRRPKKK